MTADEMKIRGKVAKRLQLLDEGEVIIFTQITIWELNAARVSGELKYVTCFDDRRFYEVVEVLGWLRGRQALGPTAGTAR